MNAQARLQRNLPLLRACAGWTAQDLADLLEVTRQTISLWENYDSNGKKKGVKLSKTQYLAIRKLLDDEVAKDNAGKNSEKPHILSTLLEVLVDHPENYTDDDRNAILAEAKLLAPSIIKQPQQRKSLSDIWPALIVGCGTVLSIAALALLNHENK